MLPKKFTFNFVKNSLIVIVILLTIYCLFKLINLKTEHFNYLSNTIQLSKEAYKPLKISSGYKGGNYDNIVTQLSTIYPFIIQNHNGSSFQNVKNLLNGTSDICICQLDAALSALNGDYPFKKEHNHLRFICNLYLETATLISRVNSGIENWQNLKGKTVCIGTNTFSSYYNFIILAKIAGIKNPLTEINIITKNIFDEDIINKFINNEIDALYVTSPHPRKEIYDLYVKKRFKIIGLKGLNKDLLKLRLPDFKLVNIDLIDYNIGNEQNQESMSVQSLGVPCCLITTKKISNNYIFKLIKTIFSNLEYLRLPSKIEVENREFLKRGEYNEDGEFIYISTSSTKSQTKDSPQTLKNLDKKRLKSLFYRKIMSQILPSQILDFPIDMKVHEGAKNYYKSIGIISNINNYDCANYAGSRKCIGKKNNKRHYGHGSIVQPLIRDIGEELVDKDGNIKMTSAPTLPPTATKDPNLT